MKKWIVPVLIITLAYACKKDKDNPAPTNLVKYKAVLSGANEVSTTPNTSTATGEAVGTFNKDTKVLTLTITYNGLTTALTAWHIHKAATGVNGPVIFNIGTPQPSGLVFTSTALTADQEADLTNNLYYVNLHTSTYPGGEIRGQLNTY
jgi:hypothetical protein